MGEDSREQLVELIRSKGAMRSALIISAREISLNDEGSNLLYILELGQGDAAGGRAGGFGQRRVVRAHRFAQERGKWTKTTEIHQESLPEGFEPPYHAAAIPVAIDESDEVMVAGIVDEILVSEYDKEFEI